MFYKSIKKRLIVLIFSVFIYFLLVFLYNNILKKSDYIEAYILKENISRGKTLNLEDLEKVYFKDDSNINLKKITLYDNFDKYISKYDMVKGSLLLKDNFVLYDEYIKASDDNEVISIKISNPEDIVSYQIYKNSIVNIYYTGKLEFANSILNNLNSLNISTNDESKSSNGYITAKLASNVKVINLFDRYGNVVESDNEKKNESNKIDTVMFELNKDLIMNINNLKNYGEFYITIER